MNKQVYIDKIAIITDELQQITSSWLRNDYKITELEVENYLSNIRYLTEQSALLKRYLLEAENEVVTNIMPEQVIVEPTLDHLNSMDDLHMHISEVQTQKPVEESISEEQTLHQKLSAQVKEHSIADTLKNNYFNRELTFSLNEKILFIQQLFNGDEKDFNKVIAHLATLDSMEEVDFYLCATCFTQYDWENKADTKSQFYKMLESRF
ncbi:MAG: hypothetical protein ACK45U_03070 [bacterium]|jgi:hypothetical protein